MNTSKFTRWGGHLVIAAGAAALSFAAAAPSLGAAAAAPGSAEGDGYAVYAQGYALGNGPVKVGPISAARAQVPGAAEKASAAVVSYNSCVASGSNPCASFQQPLVDYFNTLGSNAAATIGGAATTNCAIPDQATPADFVNGALTGGSACSYVQQVGLLNSGTAPKAADLVTAHLVEAQSLTQGCTTAPRGMAHFVDLVVGGQSIDATPPPNTEIDLQVAKVILNEQVPDNHGHGLTVNAIHVITSTQLGQVVSADIIVGHAHSEAFCPDSLVDTGSTPGAPNRPVVTKTDSTKHADPSEALTYTVAIDNKGCAVTSVTDVLPPHFHFVSAAGPLGTATVSTLPNGQEELFWANGGQAYPLTPNPMVETLQVKIDATAPAGQYINNVNGTSACGSFLGSDLTTLGTGPAANTGDNPGVIVPRPTTAAAAPKVAPPDTGGPALLPMTSRGSDAAGVAVLLVIAAIAVMAVFVVPGRRTPTNH